RSSLKRAGGNTCLAPSWAVQESWRRTAGKALDEGIKLVLGQDLVEPLIKRMSGRARQIRGRHKERLLSAGLTFSHRHAKSSKVTPKVLAPGRMKARPPATFTT